MENAPTLEEKITRQPLHLTIPKFSIDFNVDLIENLRQQVNILKSFNPKVLLAPSFCGEIISIKSVVTKF